MRVPGRKDMIRFNDILEKLSPSYPEKDRNLLKKAYVFAASAHKGQVRRSGEPYMSHPLEVTNMLLDMKMDMTTLTAGLLHDVLEDTDTTAPDLQKAFGKDVAHLVEGVTKISLIQDSSPETRQAESIRKIILAMTDDLRVIFIKLADRIHNLKTLKFLSENKQKRVAMETLELYAPIANRLGMGRIKAELEDLSFQYVDPENFFKISSLVDPKRKQVEKELKKHRKKIQDLMAANEIEADVVFRIKRLYSIYSKMKRQTIHFDQVYDFMAIRLITDTTQNCYAALGVIHQNWPHLPHRFRDFISMPKPNLYQSLHTTIITEKKQTIEVQIRTRKMHDLAENGISAHWRYKEMDPSSIVKEDKRLHWLREMVDLYKEQKSPQQFLKNVKTGLIPEEVYVYTPKGETVTLPLGASALDFAFKIHSEIGLHAVEAIINGRTAPLKTILKTGDIIEITTSPEKKPSRRWMNMIFTSTARHHLKHWLNLQDRKKNRELGEKLWKKACLKYKLPSASTKEKKLLGNLAETTNFRIKTVGDFYALIGSGKIVLNKRFLEKLFTVTALEEKKESLLSKVVTKVRTAPSSAILVKDMDDRLVNLARCCFPVKGEPIIGYMTSGKGLTIHSLHCPKVKKEILDENRLVEVLWDKASAGLYKATLLIKGEDSPGVLAQLTSIIAQLEGNISKAEVKTSADKKAQIKLTLRIKDIKHLQDIMNKVGKIKEIFTVERI
jgi:guanosine-3',5'-bis(diphosphate) 3'-pyrophosphohydrolase